MAWKGKIFGALLGYFSTHSIFGAIVGALIGHLFDQTSDFRAPSARGASVSEVFFKTTFEFMGHVAKADGRVSEAEIEAARRVMQDFRLSPDEVSVAIACYRIGKSAAYEPVSSIERLRAACALRQDLLHTFVELQLRAALAGNGISPPARAILTQVGARLGISAFEFARMEAGLRARRQQGSRRSGPDTVEKPLADCYAELGVNASMSDKEVIKAYRRQMSRHHPDKLVANGLPESMAEMAKEKTQRIQEAYEAIRAARGMR